MKPLWRKHKTWLLTAALVVAPLGGVALILYSLTRLALNRRKGRSLDPYAEWLNLRQQLRNRHTSADNGDGEARHSVSSSSRG